ncbi:MAG: SDR family oxidoreductase [Methyloceanibacter sp.]
MKVVIIAGPASSVAYLQLSSSRADTTSASPSTGVNSLTGEGLREVLTRANVVVDVTNSPSFEDNAVLEFFRRSTGHLLGAAAAAGVFHYIALSVVGSDRIPNSGYLRAKRVQEGLIEAGGVPYTVLRATQFFEFLNAIADGGTEGNVVYMSPSEFQPVAADDVAATLAEIATAQPKNGFVELAGPEASSMAEFIQSFLSSMGDERKVIPDPMRSTSERSSTKAALPPRAISLLDRHALPIGHAPNAELPHQKESHREENLFAAAGRHLTAIDKCGNAGDECPSVESVESL